MRPSKTTTKTSHLLPFYTCCNVFRRQNEWSFSRLQTGFGYKAPNKMCCTGVHKISNSMEKQARSLTICFASILNGYQTYLARTEIQRERHRLRSSNCIYHWDSSRVRTGTSSHLTLTYYSDHTETAPHWLPANRNRKFLHFRCRIRSQYPWCRHRKS